ncbi:ABC transporter substrate-binding protein [Desulfonatronospira sp.]|uniref:ABC transporter substrate-binding protein n=1 Tax=Desulfonatronospira sp. TaxID=1962951 RepID=UPI0025C38757|nr:ABC transporter substrate-binding protein [Desulfonatronospira sp.]
MKRILNILVLAVFGLMLLAGSALAQDKVRIGTEGAYPPFNYIDQQGNLKGFDIDIAKALCDAANFECEFVTQSWDGIIPALLARDYDAIIASMSITEERKRRVDFTEKYYQTPARFVKHKDRDIEISDESLEGLSVGVQRATVSANFINDNFDNVLNIRSYATQEEANLDMVAGRVDLLFADAVVLQTGFLDSEAGQDYEFVGPSYTDEQWFGEGIGIALRKGEDELRQAFNQAIADIRADGTYQEINDRYFDFDVYGDE